MDTDSAVAVPKLVLGWDVETYVSAAGVSMTLAGAAAVFSAPNAAKAMTDTSVRKDARNSRT